MQWCASFCSQSWPFSGVQPHHHRLAMHSTPNTKNNKDISIYTDVQKFVIVMKLANQVKPVSLVKLLNLMHQVSRRHNLFQVSGPDQATLPRCRHPRHPTPSCCKYTCSSVSLKVRPRPKLLHACTHLLCHLFVADVSSVLELPCLYVGVLGLGQPLGGILACGTKLGGAEAGPQVPFQEGEPQLTK